MASLCVGWPGEAGEAGVHYGSGVVRRSCMRWVFWDDRVNQVRRVTARGGGSGDRRCRE